MAIRLPTVANINYYDPNKQATGIFLDDCSQYVTTGKNMGNYSQSFYANAVSGDFTDSGFSANASVRNDTNVILQGNRYLFFGVVVPGPSASRNNIPLTYGFSGSFNLRSASNHHLPRIAPFVATVSSFNAGPTQSLANIIGLQFLPAQYTRLSTNDFLTDIVWHLQLTYNTYSHNTRVIFGVMLYNDNSSDIHLWRPFGGLSVNALHHLREIFDPNLG